MTRQPTTYAEAMALAVASRDRANRIKQRIVRDEEARSPGQAPIVIEVRANTRVGQDPVWKAAAADNRWYLDQATAYGIGELITAVRELTRALTERAE